MGGFVTVSFFNFLSKIRGAGGLLVQGAYTLLFEVTMYFQTFFASKDA